MNAATYEWKFHLPNVVIMWNFFGCRFPACILVDILSYSLTNEAILFCIVVVMLAMLTGMVSMDEAMSFLLKHTLVGESEVLSKDYSSNWMLGYVPPTYNIYFFLCTFFSFLGVVFHFSLYKMVFLQAFVNIQAMQGCHSSVMETSSNLTKKYEADCFYLHSCFSGMPSWAHDLIIRQCFHSNYLSVFIYVKWQAKQHRVIWERLLRSSAAGTQMSSSS